MKASLRRLAAETWVFMTRWARPAPAPAEQLSYLAYLRMLIEDDPDPVRASMIALADVARAKMPEAKRAAHRVIAEAALANLRRCGKTEEQAYRALSGRVFSLLIGLSEMAGDPEDEEGGAK